MDTDYTKRELDAKFGEVHERFTRQDTTLEKILLQTTAHNGRMKKLETRDAYMRGGLAVITIILVPILLFIVTHLFALKK